MTLSEVLIGLCLLALVTVVAAVVLEGVLRELGHQEHKTRALYLAQEQLERVFRGPALQPVTQAETVDSGVFAAPFQDYRWTLSSLPLETPGMAQLKRVVQGPARTQVELTAQRRRSRRVVWLASNHAGKDHQLYESEEGLGALHRVSPDWDGEFAQPTLSGDGQLAMALWRHAGTSQLVRVPPDGSSPQLLALKAFPRNVSEIALSPDGTQLAYSFPGANESRVAIVDLRSQRVVAMSPSGVSASSPCWNPNGRALALVLSSSSSSAIATMDVPDGRLERWVETSGWNLAPSFSPDGRQLAFSSNRDGNPEIYVLELRSKNLRRLTENPAYDTAPHFSPDGLKLIFSSDRDGDWRLYEVNQDGSELRPWLTQRYPAGVEMRDAVFQPGN
jgi:hypothetical protein